MSGQHAAKDRDGNTVMVNASDLVDARCSNCRRSGTTKTLRVSFMADIPPRGRAYWVCAGGCPG